MLQSSLINVKERWLFIAAAQRGVQVWRQIPQDDSKKGENDTDFLVSSTSATVLHPNSHLKKEKKALKVQSSRRSALIIIISVAHCEKQIKVHFCACIKSLKLNTLPGSHVPLPSTVNTHRHTRRENIIWVNVRIDLGRCQQRSDRLFRARRRDILSEQPTQLQSCPTVTRTHFNWLYDALWSHPSKHSFWGFAK